MPRRRAAGTAVGPASLAARPGSPTRASAVRILPARVIAIAALRIAVRAALHAAPRTTRGISARAGLARCIAAWAGLARWCIAALATLARWCIATLDALALPARSAGCVAARASLHAGISTLSTAAWSPAALGAIAAALAGLPARRVATLAGTFRVAAMAALGVSTGALSMAPRAAALRAAVSVPPMSAARGLAFAAAISARGACVPCLATLAPAIATLATTITNALAAALAAAWTAAWTAAPRGTAIAAALRAAETATRTPTVATLVWRIAALATLTAGPARVPTLRTWWSTLATRIAALACTVSTLAPGRLAAVAAAAAGVGITGRGRFRLRRSVNGLGRTLGRGTRRAALHARTEVDVAHHALVDQEFIGRLVSLGHMFDEVLLHHVLDQRPAFAGKFRRAPLLDQELRQGLGTQDVSAGHFLAVQELHAQAQVVELPRRLLADHEREAARDDLALDHVVADQLEPTAFQPDPRRGRRGDHCLLPRLDGRLSPHRAVAFELEHRVAALVHLARTAAVVHQLREAALDGLHHGSYRLLRARDELLTRLAREPRSGFVWRLGDAHGCS